MGKETIGEDFAAARQQHKAGRLAEAEALYRQILASDPQQAEVHYNLGLVLRARGLLPEAAQAYEQALAARPRFPQAANNLGAVLEQLGRLDEAEDMLRHALLLQPDLATAWNNLGGVLKDLGRVEEAIACQARAVELEPENPRFHSNLIFSLHYSPAYDAAALLREARRWNERHAQTPAGPIVSHPNDPAPGRRLRVGYVSANFRAHCQAQFMVPLLAAADHSQFEVFAYSDVTVPDGMTHRLQAGVEHWRTIAGQDDAEVAARIREDGIDVLVDLTLHMGQDRLRLFARKPAPVQVTWLGYPGTTGLGAMDWRLTDPHLDPAGQHEGDYAERSFRLADTFWCYDPLASQPSVNRLPAQQARGFTFGCLNNFCKVNTAVLDLWLRVLLAVPDSKLLMLAPPGAARARVRARLGAMSGRVEFAGYQPRAQYLELYHRIDLGLDTFPYNGHTTSLDALWMGVPVVSLCGPTVVGRAGLSLMANLGLRELVADTPEQFIRVAVAVAADRDRLACWRAGLRERMRGSALMDAPRFARQVEQAYRAMWQDWCRRACHARAPNV